MLISFTATQKIKMLNTMRGKPSAAVGGGGLLTGEAGNFLCQV